MPTFGTVPIGEARANTVTGQRAALLQEYVVLYPARALGTGGGAEARRERDDPGDPAQAQRSSGNARPGPWRFAVPLALSTSGRRGIGDAAGPARIQASSSLFLKPIRHTGSVHARRACLCQLCTGSLEHTDNVRAVSDVSSRDRR